MRTFVLAISAGFFLVNLVATADAKGHRRHVVPADYSYAAPYWGYHKWVPWGAYQTTVTYGPDNRRCVSQLVLLPSGWWRPARRCEFVVSG